MLYRVAHAELRKKTVSSISERFVGSLAGGTASIPARVRKLSRTRLGHLNDVVAHGIEH